MYTLIYADNCAQFLMCVCVCACACVCVCAVITGGRAAEQVTFGKVTTGASDDLRRVTDLAYTMYTQYGMSPTIGTLAWSDFPQPEQGYRFSSNHHASTVEKEVRAVVDRAYKRSVGLLEEHQDKLVMLSETLLKDEVLTYDQVEAVIGARPFDHVNPLLLADDDANDSTNDGAGNDGSDDAKKDAEDAEDEDGDAGGASGGGDGDGDATGKGEGKESKLAPEF